jgi:Arc/MetJ-type ribon-helix-helix transcriptional regulator
MSEPQDLEKAAKEYVAAAVDFEKQGENEKAIELYQKAIENLNCLVKLHPYYGFKGIYADRSALYQERMKRLQEERTALEESLPEEKAAEATVQEENRVDLAAILQEINNKLDALTGQVAELKDEVSVLKLNVNDVVGKTEQAHKEVAEIRNLVYAIKYER